MVGTSNKVLTNSIPLMSNISLAILGKSKVFHNPLRTSSTKAHWAIDISSLVILGVALASLAPTMVGATIPAAPNSRDFSINFLLSIILIGHRLLLNDLSWLHVNS